jgi:hypothetical protein
MLHPSLFIRKKSFDRLCGYNEKYRYASDYDLVCRLAQLGTIESLPIPLLQYRLHGKQISTQKRAEQKEYAAEIRRNYQLAVINQSKRKKQQKAGCAEVGHAEMGKVISLYSLSRELPDKKLEETAGILLDNIFQEVDFTTPLIVNDGLLGIACGLRWLLRNGFVDGDEDEILQEIDDMILRTIIFQRDTREVDRKGQLYYLCRRISISPDKANRVTLLKNKKTVLSLLDSFERDLQLYQVKNPEILKELRVLYKMGLFKSKIQKMLSLD